MRVVRVGVLCVCYMAVTVSSSLAKNPFETLLNAVDSLQDVLEHKPDGGGKTIGDPGTETNQRLHILKTFSALDGTPCREYKREILVQPEPVTVYGRACRHDRGAWIIELESYDQLVSVKPNNKLWSPPAEVQTVKEIPNPKKASNSPSRKVLEISAALKEHKPIIVGSSFCQNPYDHLGKNISVVLAYNRAVGRNVEVFGCKGRFIIVDDDGSGDFINRGLIDTYYNIIGKLDNERSFIGPDGVSRKALVIKKLKSFRCSTKACQEREEAARL